MGGRSQGSGSARHGAAAKMALALLAALQGAMAATYTVGDAAGWDLNVSYSAWAAQHTFQVGDTLEFNYNPEMHSVFQVDEANFKACNLFPAINKYQSGSDSITLTQSTTYYFVCGTPGHCNQGMALEIPIGGSKQATPSPTPVVAPAPAIAPVLSAPAPSTVSNVAAPAPASTAPPVFTPTPTSPAPRAASPAPASTTPPVLPPKPASPAPLIEAPVPASITSPVLPPTPLPPTPTKAPAPSHLSPSPSPISPSPSEASIPSPSPSEATSPSPNSPFEGPSPSSSAATFPPSEAPGTSSPTNAAITLKSGAASLLSVTLLVGYLMLL